MYKLMRDGGWRVLNDRSIDSPSTACTCWHKLHNLTCCSSLSILLLTLSRKVLTSDLNAELWLQFKLHIGLCVGLLYKVVFVLRSAITWTQVSKNRGLLISFSNSDIVYAVYLLNIRNRALAVVSW